MTTRTKTRSAIRVLGLSLLALLALASPLAIRPAGASGVLGVLPDAVPDSLLILLPPRAADAVNQDLAIVGAAESAASADLVSAQGRLGEAKARVDVCASEIEAIKARVKLAKEQKNQTEQANLELQIKAKELLLDALKARKEMRDAEAVWAEARRKAAQVQSGFFKKELELLEKRGALSAMSSPGAGTTNLDGLLRLRVEVRDLERRGLEIAKDAVDKEKSAAESGAGLLDKRLKLEEAQRALVAGPKK
jgi:hypothetical protein